MPDQETEPRISLCSSGLRWLYFKINPAHVVAPLSRATRWKCRTFVVDVAFLSRVGIVLEIPMQHADVIELVTTCGYVALKIDRNGRVSPNWARKAKWRKSSLRQEIPELDDSTISFRETQDLEGAYEISSYAAHHRVRCCQLHIGQPPIMNQLVNRSTKSICKGLLKLRTRRPRMLTCSFLSPWTNRNQTK